MRKIVNGSCWFGSVGETWNDECACWAVGASLLSVGGLSPGADATNTLSRH